MSPTEINELFETMANGLATARAGAAGQPPAAPGQPPAPPAPPKPPEQPPVDYKKLLDPTDPEFNPERAFAYFVTKNYGGLIGDMNMRSVMGVIPVLAEEFPDIGEYRNDINQALSGRDPTTIGPRDVMAAYLTAKGLRATLKERADRAGKKGTTTVPPSPPPPTPPGDTPLSDAEKDVAHRMFRKSADPEKDYKVYLDKINRGETTMQVPIGGGKKA